MEDTLIPFNKPFLTGKEAHYIYQAVYSGKLSGNGAFTKRCQDWFQKRYGIKHALLTTSCTDALEMAALLIDITPGDEVIVPSYTFVSSALAFVRQGAVIRFLDSRNDHPGMDENQIKSLITDKTKAIVVVHYAGVACDMDKIMDIASEYGLIVIEDAAQGIESFYKGRPLGSIGQLGTFSFHETKNVISGEGGLLAINDERYVDRAEIIWEKGTNRASFFRGEINKYGWVDVGSSFLPSEIVAAFLYAQLENIKTIQERRTQIWMNYWNGLSPFARLGYFQLPELPSYASNNAHMFYLILPNLTERTAFIDYLKSRGILTVFHYLSLHSSPYYAERHDGRSLAMSDHYSDCLVRLPFYYDLDLAEQNLVLEAIREFTEQRHV